MTTSVQKTTAAPGILYIVATPIGNLSDISGRAIQVLRQADIIAVEDTRRSRTLLEHHAIKTRLTACHAHNEIAKTAELQGRLLAGQTVALISDAGTPLINDPGYRLVSAAHDHAIRVVPIPGPAALIAALSASGLATHRFCFEGYPPATDKARKDSLRRLQGETRTLVFYETPRRIAASIRLMTELFGAERRAAIARELTKQFEQIVRAPLGELNARLAREEIKNKGEFVVVVEGRREGRDNRATTEARRIQAILTQALPPGQAARLTAEITGGNKNEIYRLAMRDKE